MVRDAQIHIFAAFTVKFLKFSEKLPAKIRHKKDRKMTTKKPCFYLVSSLFVENNSKLIFYRYQHMCTRAWQGLNFSPKSPEVKQYILDKEWKKVRRFIEAYKAKKARGKIQPSSYFPMPPPGEKFWNRASPKAIDT